jgi:glycosyltransferase involved in cell wall biosynthesis
MPSVVVLYQFFHPDDVVSARIFATFAADLAACGWQVAAWPSNRACHETGHTFPPTDLWQGVAIRRVWRPDLRQNSGAGRILNALWMVAAWSARLLVQRRLPDVLVIGTDPVLSVLVAFFARMLSRKIRIVHWCFDLYPEGPIADGMFRDGSLLVRFLQYWLRHAYRSCDLVADLGSCMRRRLEHYGHSCRKVTLVPWALTEPAEVAPPDPATHAELFGDSTLGLLYSGNFGRAHGYADFLDLARRLRGASVQFCFGVRGNRAQQLRQAVLPDDTNVSFADFASEAALPKRLAAADIHLVSLRPEWTGLVVPSKFFGCLAAGRPVIFAGSRDSAIARWIEEHGVGWVLDTSSQDAIAAELQGLTHAPATLADLQRRCHRVYQEQFSRSMVTERWDSELRSLLPDPVLVAAERLA